MTIYNTNWIFSKPINIENLPRQIREFRNLNNGKDLNYFNTYFKKIKRVDSVKSSIYLLQIIEPMYLIKKENLLDDFSIELFELTYYEVFTNLVGYYPIICAKEQLINTFETMSFFSNEFNDILFYKQSSFAELETTIKVHEIVKSDGFIYIKDINKINSFKDIHLQKNFIIRLCNIGNLKETKKGNFNILTFRYILDNTYP
jgi:hypothetical protein